MSSVDLPVTLYYLLAIVCTQAQLEESSRADFIRQPLSVVQTQQLEAVFECQYTDEGTVTYNWIIDGEPFVGSTSIRGTSPSYPGGPVSLIVTALPEHDNATIQCEGYLRRPGGVKEFLLSDIASLRVQGPLDPVTNLVFDTTLLSSTSITISWTAPFSLDLTTAEPDIQYCVDVYNVTRGEDDHIHSECNITDTSYTFPASDPDQLFNFTVTPRSNVEGSLNGTTSQPVQGFVCRDQDFLMNLSRFEGEPIVTSPEGGKICLSCPFSSTHLTHCVGVFHSAQFEDRTLIVLSVELNTGSSCNDSLTGGDYKYDVFGLSDQGLQEIPGFTSSITVSEPVIILPVVSGHGGGGNNQVVAVIAGVLSAVIQLWSSL